ncbi:MAG: hydrogenase maturation protease [Peptococcaceae bacterium]
MLKKVLVLGVGNVLLKDDGLGPLAVNSLAEKLQDPRVTFLDGGTLGLDLLAYLDGYDYLIIVDAVNLGAEPGQIFCWEGQTLTGIAAEQVSLHEMGVQELLQAARLLGLDLAVTIIGIQAAELSWGMELSNPVQKSVPLLQGAVLNKIHDFLKNQEAVENYPIPESCTEVRNKAEN